MSGPQYPLPAIAGSNSIGQYEIGVSQIGDIPIFDYWDTIASQFANSAILTKIIGNIAAYIDQTENLSNFFDAIWNIDTAFGYGLDLWGRIVGITRILNVPSSSPFGFHEALPGVLDFNSSAQGFGTFSAAGSFYFGTDITSNFLLSDSAFRSLILAKAASNITNGSIPSINAILKTLFPERGNCYVVDGAISSALYFGFAEASGGIGGVVGFNQDAFYNGQSLPHMTMTYVFNFGLSPFELALVQQSGILPKPVGVLANTLVI